MDNTSVADLFSPAAIFDNGDAGPPALEMDDGESPPSTAAPATPVAGVPARRASAGGGGAGVAAAVGAGVAAAAGSAGVTAIAVRALVQTPLKKVASVCARRCQY